MARPGIDRRAFLGGCAASTAAVALRERLAWAAEANDGHPLAPRGGHFEPRARQLIFVFLTGGFSQVDTFDPKPRLSADQGRIVNSTELRGAITQPLLGTPFKFSRCGESGLEISELFPQLAGVADELCVIRSLHTDIVEHFQATLAMHTGSATVPLPSIGAWLSYGLGTFNPNLPSYLVLAEHLPYAGAQVWDNNFLPPFHQGVRILPGDEPIPDLRSPARNATLAELEAAMLRDANAAHAASRQGDLTLRARMNSFDVARGMMREAPEAFDLRRETAATLSTYGASPGDNRSFAAQCLLARRLIERGVRVVELIDTGSHDNWDAHGDMQQHRGKAQRVDRALAALLRDLRQRGLLDETLVAVCTEFGRTPWSDNGKGRNHWHRAFSCLLAGGGVKGGVSYGETDEYGAEVVAEGCHVHDYHATILHLMGIDHERLTYRYAGRDFRLTDVSGNVLTKVLA
ncbi:MAG TPA: DUF1501 domain-containing protein [Pirellulales bacterium]|jgi:uncharacterized protein (DUF1501 family)|nr:DUF1501 domain-containing protein [Pirellulales bacterium]